MFTGTFYLGFYFYPIPPFETDIDSTSILYTYILTLLHFVRNKDSHELKKYISRIIMSLINNIYFIVNHLYQVKIR